MFLQTCKNCYKTQTRIPITLTFCTQKGSTKANPSIKFGVNLMNGSGVMSGKLLCRWSNYRRSAFWWFERNRDKDHGDMTQNPTYVTITRSIFMNKTVLVFTATRQTA